MHRLSSALRGAAGGFGQRPPCSSPSVHAPIRQDASIWTATERRKTIAAASSKIEVQELVLLLEAAPNASEADVQQLLERLFVLQYLVPRAQVLCAACGPVVRRAAPAGNAASNATTNANATNPTGSSAAPVAPAFTHVLYYRLPNAGALDGFTSHPTFAKAWRQEVAALCPSALLLAFAGQVDSGMEGLFRRGDEYRVGFEELLLLRTQQPSAAGGSASSGSGTGNAPSGADAQAAAQQQADFFGKLEGLARSGSMGALQASHGRVARLEALGAATAGFGTADGPAHGTPGGLSPEYAFMARFPTVEQLAAFQQSAVYNALFAGDARLPAVALAALAVDVQPPEDSQDAPAASLFSKRK